VLDGARLHPSGQEHRNKQPCPKKRCISIKEDIMTHKEVAERFALGQHGTGTGMISNRGCIRSGYSYQDNVLAVTLSNPCGSLRYALNLSPISETLNRQYVIQDVLRETCVGLPFATLGLAGLCGGNRDTDVGKKIRIIHYKPPRSHHNPFTGEWLGWYRGQAVISDVDRTRFFLSTYDESSVNKDLYCLIELPEPVPTVGEAERALMPERVRREHWKLNDGNIRRQGEWFFVRMPADEPTKGRLKATKGWHAIGGSNHVAQYASGKDVTWVCGTIRHNYLQGKSNPPEHRMLKLGTQFWWEVHKNRKVASFQKGIFGTYNSAAGKD